MRRVCVQCEKTVLNRYHVGNLCYSCQEKKQQELQKELSDTPHYTLDNMCFLLGLQNPESVKRLARRVKIPGRVPGIRKYLYQKEQIDKWIRDTGKSFDDEKERQQPKETTSDPRLMKHLNELAETADILAHHVRRLIRYKDYEDIDAMGDILGHLTFWRKSNGTIVTEGTDPIGEFRYEEEHPVDPHQARWLYIHYDHRFGKPPFEEWNQLSTGNVTLEIVDNLKLLAHSGLKRCPNCPICKEIMD